MQGPDFSGEVHRQRAVLMAVAQRSTEHPAVRNLRLKGSLAAGTPDRHSDVDLAVQVDSGSLGALWGARVALTTIGTPLVLDLDHHWGGSGLSYAVWYDTGVYLDLTLTDQDAPEAGPSAFWPLWRRVGPRVSAPSAPDSLPAVQRPPPEDTLRMFWMGAPLRSTLPERVGGRPFGSSRVAGHSWCERGGCYSARTGPTGAGPGWPTMCRPPCGTGWPAR